MESMEKCDFENEFWTFGNKSQPTFISGANLHFGKIELNTSLESMEKCDSENEGLS